MSLGTRISRFDAFTCTNSLTYTNVCQAQNTIILYAATGFRICTVLQNKNKTIVLVYSVPVNLSGLNFQKSVA